MSILIFSSLICAMGAFLFFYFVVRAWVAPPRRDAANTAAYYAEENFPQVADPELGMWNRPNHHFVKDTLVSGGGLLRTEIWFDCFGVRVGGPGVETPGKVDMLVVGESNTWGQGLAYEDTYAALLGRTLGMSVANLGLIGSSGVQSLLVLRRFIGRKPKLIIYGLWEEHFTSNIRRCQNTDSPVCLPRPKIVRRFGGFAVSPPRGAKRALREFLRWSHESAARGPRSFRRDLYWTARVMVRDWGERYVPRLRRGSRPWGAIACSLGWRTAIGATKFVISSMKTLADTANATLVVVYLPFYFYDKVSSPPEELRDHTVRIGALFISMDEVWDRRKKEGSEFVIPAEGHLNATGHRDIAEAVEAALVNSACERIKLD